VVSAKAIPAGGAVDLHWLDGSRKANLD
jgi:hypothetical protein